jgi:hypothetical protein
VSADAPKGFLPSNISGAYSLLLDSIEAKVAGKSLVTLGRLLGCLRDRGMLQVAGLLDSPAAL